MYISVMLKIGDDVMVRISGNGFIGIITEFVDDKVMVSVPMKFGNTCMDTVYTKENIMVFRLGRDNCRIVRDDDYC